MASPEENRNRIIQAVAAFNRGDLDGLLRKLGLYGWEAAPRYAVPQ